MRKKKVPGISKASVLVRTNASGLKIELTQDRLMHERLVFVNWGVVDAVSNWPLVIKIANWSKCTVMLPKIMAAAQCLQLHIVTDVL